MQLLATAVFRLLLFAHPPESRRRYGGEIVQTFIDRSAATRRRGFTAVVALWMRELPGLVAAGIRARRRQRETKMPRTGNHGRLPGKSRASLMDTFLQDLRYAARVLAKNPGFAAVAVIALAIGIGANTAIFSVVDAVILRPLPFEEPERLVAIWEQNPERGWYKAQVAAANFLDWQERAGSVVGMAAHNDWLIQLPLAVEGEPQMVFANEVTGTIFDVLGVQPMLGEGFSQEHTWATAEPVVVLSHAFWMSHFGSDPTVVGSRIALGGVSRTVLGVMPPRFTYPYVFPAGLSGLPEIDLWVPVAWDPQRRDQVSFRRAHGMSVVGRLEPGVTLPEAEAELAAIAANLERLYPETNTLMGNGVTPLHDWIVGDNDLPLLLMLTAVGFVLLIACANVANMLLARASARQGEMAIRTALGAGRDRLLRQGLTESLLLSLAGGILGVAAGYSSINLLLALKPEQLPRLDAVSLDGRMLAFVAAVTLLTGLVFGAVPAWNAARPDPATDLGESGRGSSASRASRRATRILVAAEVALALPVVVAAGLMARALLQLHDVNPGFDLARTLIAQISLPDSSYPSGQEIVPFYLELTRAMREVPGVESAAMSSRMPFRNQRWSSDFTVEGWAEGQHGQGVRHGEITTDFFETMGIPLLRGRAFDEADRWESPLVVIINETLATTYFPNEDPIGKRVTFDAPPDENSFWREIVGVVGDVKRESLGSQPKAEFYAPVLQEWTRGMYLLVKTDGEPLSLIGAVRAQVRQIDPNLPVFGFATLEEVHSGAMANERFLLTLFGAFAVVALVLAAAGVYGVISYLTSQRTREIGIRMALGARRGDVVRWVMMGGMAPVIAGIGFGVVAAAFVSRLMATLLFGVPPLDPVTFVGASALLAAVALVACIVPARRAVKVDAVVALRSE